MGISIIHITVVLLMVGAVIRTITYHLLQNNPDSRLGKFLAYSY